MDRPYPHYDVLDKWDSTSFDQPTRAVLAVRLGAPPARRFFSETEWRALDAVAARLIPQPERAHPVPLTAWIDADLAEGRQEGYRYADMPPVALAWRRGLAAIDGEAGLRFGCTFGALAPARADALLHAIERGAVDPALWAGLPARRFFSEVLLKNVAAIYYAHPAAWSEIGFGGPASPRGYVRLGFDRRDPWEAA